VFPRGLHQSVSGSTCDARREGVPARLGAGPPYLWAVPRDNKLTKSAGEHFVCSELARRGWAGSLTRDGLERTDILAIHPDSGRMVALQVKAALPKPSWLVGVKGMQPSRQPNEYFTFVHLGLVEERPSVWVVPRDHLAAVAWVGFHAWRYAPEHEGNRHADVSAARVAPSDFERYENRWDLLGQPTDQAPVLLPEWVLADIPAWGLPNGHPGFPSEGIAPGQYPPLASDR
jgi:hypothetical protein